MVQLSKRPNSPPIGCGELIVGYLEATGEVPVPGEAGTVLGGTPVRGISKPANDAFLKI